MEEAEAKKRTVIMSTSSIVQKLWNYCNVLPACRALLGAGRRDDLSARAQAGGMSYGGQVTSSRCRPLEERCRQFLVNLL